MRGRWIWSRERQTLVPAAEFYRAKYEGMTPSDMPAPMVMRDTEPYRSIITREVIGGRRQHRDHLKAHGCIEVGNEYLPPAPRAEMRPVAQDLERAMSDEGLRAEAMAAQAKFNSVEI